MAEFERHVFYGDLNCPFWHAQICYAQNERLKASGGAHLVEWRGLNHMPDLPSPMRRVASDVHALATELKSVAERAPDVRIYAIANRPNTKLATLAVAAARAIDHAKARALKDALYKAVWVDGSDISSASVVQGLCQKLGVPTEGLEAFHLTTSAWHKQWEDGPFEQRLPTMRSRFGGVMLGMATRTQLSDFLWTRTDVRNHDDSCG